MRSPSHLLILTHAPTHYPTSSPTHHPTFSPPHTHPRTYSPPHLLTSTPPHLFTFTPPHLHTCSLPQHHRITRFFRQSGGDGVPLSAKARRKSIKPAPGSATERAKLRRNRSVEESVATASASEGAAAPDFDLLAPTLTRKRASQSGRVSVSKRRSSG